jgi:Spy/CpxP family protein refolding chaperone
MRGLKINSRLKQMFFNSLACAAALLFLLWVAVVSPAQEDKDKEDNFKRLQAMRVWMIIEALDIDSASEKGIALLAAINKYSDAERELMMKSHTLMEQLYDYFKSGAPPPDEAAVTQLVLALEENNLKLLNTEKEEREEMIRLLTPMERAKLMIAEENFRRRLRGAMHGGWGERGKDKRP